MELPFSNFDSTQFEKLPVLGIIRGIKRDALKGVLNSALESGLKHLEITLNTRNSFELISEAVNLFDDTLCVGAGTVITKKEAELAVSAGAKFLVSPTLNNEVASYCKQNNISYFPGALTPTEIEAAWNSGAQMVKVFPATAMGPKYFKEIKGPFSNIKLMAVGGVKKENIADYFKSGASAVAVGGSIFSVERMNNEGFSSIKEDLSEILFAVKDFLNTIR